MKYQYYFEREKRRSNYKTIVVNINYEFLKKIGMWVYAILGCTAFILAVTSILHDTLMIVINAR
ncbi:hypothetical protein [Acinetobacter baumannii]|uniref:hypothetical protein n=1 Tax=Acinetobacter baumannii TaxID=470 RepID=UPI00105807EC|nr:hypothetical protein [Acinetobacter baumannii]QBM33878.1 hypothetical protein E1A89_09960 [Acinetobacter baumannii]QBM44566.1 hypothetical protein E1A87_10995 [Acinetobacter baumannii]